MARGVDAHSGNFHKVVAVAIDTTGRFTGNRKSLCRQQSLRSFAGLVLDDLTQNPQIDAEMAMFYDMLVIGDDPEGLERAIASSRLGQRIAVVCDLEKPPSVELLGKGAELLVQTRLLTKEDGAAQKRKSTPDVTMKGWRTEVQRLSARISSTRDAQMRALGIEQIWGRARFIAATTVEIADGDQNRIASATKIVIACGTVSRQPASFQIDGPRVVVAESLLALDEIPRSALVVGAGTTGRTVAIALARLGVEVTVVDEQLSLCDVSRMFDDSWELFQSLQIAFRLGEEVIGTEASVRGSPAIRLASGRILRADAVVICVGRDGNTPGLNLESANVGLDERGRVWCDAAGQTWSPQIVAVGDVVGFPGRGQVVDHLMSAQ